MIAYFKCLCGQNKLLAKRLKDEGYEIRSVNLNRQWRDEALQYKIKLPFKVVNGKVMSL